MLFISDTLFNHLFNVKIMLFISDTQYYVPIELCKMARSIHLFNIKGTLIPENVKLKQNLIWDITEIDWKGSQYDLKWKQS